jgi:hypothetical protein
MSLSTGASYLVPHGALIAANKAYQQATWLQDDCDEAVEILSDLVQVDSNGKLIRLEEAKTETMRWQIGDNARYALRHELPLLADVRPVLRAIELDLDTEPSIEQRVDLVGAMLDIQGISPDVKYIQYLARKLRDCPPRNTETCKRSKPWFSLATISRTVDDVLMTLRPQDGRAIPPADVLDIAGKRSSELIGLRRSIVRINNTIVRLQRIVAATKDAAKPVFKDDDWDIDGSEPSVPVDDPPEAVEMIEIELEDGTVISVPVEEAA